MKLQSIEAEQTGVTFSFSAVLTAEMEAGDIASYGINIIYCGWHCRNIPFKVMCYNIV